MGPEDAFFYSLNLKPVYPMTFGKVNLINRFILPVIYQEERFEGEGSEFGLGDLTYQAFFSPAKPGKIIWGAGPAFVFPTITDNRLGVDKWRDFTTLKNPKTRMTGACSFRLSFYSPKKPKRRVTKNCNNRSKAQ